MRTYYPKPTMPTGVLAGTLCEWCRNSVPDLKGCGCSWSRKQQPVDGWIATPTVRRNSSFVMESFCVHECPSFQEDPPKKPKRRTSP